MVFVQEVAGLMGDANYSKHEAELQVYRKLFWDTVSLFLVCQCAEDGLLYNYSKSYHAQSVSV